MARKPKRTDDRRRDWIIKGRVTLNGVVFFLNDRTREEAEEMVAHGEFDDRDDIFGEAVDWNMTGLLEPNE